MMPPKPRPTRLERCQNELDNTDRHNIQLFLMARGNGFDTTPVTSQMVDGEVRRALSRFRKAAEEGSQRVERHWREWNKPVRGLELPDLGILETMRGTTTASLQHTGNPVRSLPRFLGTAIECDDMTSVRWALRAGFNPNLFDPERGITPLGLAAVTGKTKIVKLMWQAGADLAMTMRPEHGGAENNLGSTLLHRVMARAGGTNEEKEKRLAEVAVFLASKYPDPLVQDCKGRNPLEWAQRPSLARDALETWLAQRQHRMLHRQLDDRHGAGTGPAKRPKARRL